MILVVAHALACLSLVHTNTKVNTRHLYNNITTSSEIGAPAPSQVTRLRFWRKNKDAKDATQGPLLKPSTTAQPTRQSDTQGRASHERHEPVPDGPESTGVAEAHHNIDRRESVDLSDGAWTGEGAAIDRPVSSDKSGPPRIPPMSSLGYAYKRVGGDDEVSISSLEDNQVEPSPHVTDGRDSHNERVE
ncbi:hypothetical protein BU25DRAFT_413960 [Macroventuria anomochaeta]|uniref:Uncharacterized protein n=1 Tax=Macroventuria anomochaeta TaxID=301207 RepID=A0ACB6RRM1_9PLEO|nr:uncharacterized protein BU25DRAFT_413960 [Macroventuria anomochaeta]KAF2623783.1 hypothetical protein BU25DRAFT_413960 [Macroventuria anomochaeta]